MEFLAALGVPRAEQPSDTAALAARFRTASTGRRLLIVLDNARTPAQVRPLLPGGPGCHVVVTSRSDLAGLVARDGARRLVLGPLSADAADTLLRALVGPQADAEPEAVRDLAAHCDRLPLALRIAAERVASRPGAALGTLVADFADHQRRLDLLSAGGDEATAVRAVFSWSFDALPHDAARTFRLLGLHPGREFDRFAVAALTGKPARQAALATDTLADVHLVDEVRHGRYGMHDLLRSYAAELAAETEPDKERAAAVTRLLDQLSHTASVAMDLLHPHERNRRPKIAAPFEPGPALRDPAGAAVWLDAEAETLQAAARLVAADGWFHHVTQLSETLHRHLHTSGRYLDMLDLHGLALDAAWRGGDRRAEAAARLGLGIACFRLARYPEALDHLHTAMAIAEKREDRIIESGAAQGLGHVHYRLGDLATALAAFERALAVNRAIGDQAAEGASLGSIGLIYEWRGDKAAALEQYQRALAIHRESGFGVGEGDTLNNIAVVLRQTGDVPGAIAHLQAALEVYRNVSDRGGEGAVLNNLGLASIQLQRWDSARAYLEEALEVHRAINGLASEAETRNILGVLEQSTGRYDEGISRFGEALALAELTSDLGSQTIAHHGLGECLAALGRHEKALAHHELALALARQTGSVPDERRALEAMERLRMTSQQSE